MQLLLKLIINKRVTPLLGRPDFVGIRLLTDHRQMIQVLNHSGLIRRQVETLLALLSPFKFEINLKSKSRASVVSFQSLLTSVYRPQKIKKQLVDLGQSFFHLQQDLGCFEKPKQSGNRIGNSVFLESDFWIFNCQRSRNDSKDVCAYQYLLLKKQVQTVPSLHH